MKTRWLLFSVVLLAAGMGFGTGWICGQGWVRTPSFPDLSNMGGQDSKIFAEQLDDLNIQVKQYPLYARVSKDGRFDIHDLKNRNTIASDLFYPIGHGDEKERVRQFSFSCGDEACTCIIARDMGDSKIKSIIFDIDSRNKEEKTAKYVYFDSNGDGLWDRFTDFTQQPAKMYVREGTGWSWKEKAPAGPPPQERL